MWQDETALGILVSFSETNTRQGNIGQRGLLFSRKASWYPQTDSEVVVTSNRSISTCNYHSWSSCVSKNVIYLSYSQGDDVYPFSLPLFLTYNIDCRDPPHMSVISEEQQVPLDTDPSSVTYLDKLKLWNSFTD